MNATFLAADCLPRGGKVTVETSQDPAAPAFTVRGTGSHARILEEVEKAVRGDAAATPHDARGIQPYLTHKLARAVNAGLTLTAQENGVVLQAG
jgi:histidine phosphotransferase ChpT